MWDASCNLMGPAWWAVGWGPSQTYNVYLKKEKKGRGTPEGGLPVLHIGYKSCGFMQKVCGFLACGMC